MNEPPEYQPGMFKHANYPWSYSGTSLVDANGKVIGVMCVPNEVGEGIVKIVNETYKVYANFFDPNQHP